jgi:glutathione peroxidase
MSQSIYDFTTVSLGGLPINLADYKGKVIMIVNVASKCGLTPQYIGLEELHHQYFEKGLVIIGFPCNQFGGQEPGDADEIAGNCLKKYGVEFLITQKIDVNGPDTDPIFKYLKEELPGALNINAIKWNFGKFLIDSEGNPYKRYAPVTEPQDMVEDIEMLLTTISNK